MDLDVFISFLFCSLFLKLYFRFNSKSCCRFPRTLFPCSIKFIVNCVDYFFPDIRTHACPKMSMDYY